MKRVSKEKIILLLTIILGISSIIRIVYVNSVQHTTKIHTYHVGDVFEYNGFQMEVEEANIYTAEDIKREYKDIPDEILNENDIIIRLKMKNCTDRENEINMVSFTMQEDMEIGGIDPYLYQYMNPNQSGTLRLEKKGEQTITLAFPTERAEMSNDDKLKLILALYPEKYEIKL